MTTIMLKVTRLFVCALVKYLTNHWGIASLVYVISKCLIYSFLVLYISEILYSDELKVKSSFSICLLNR